MKLQRIGLTALFPLLAMLTVGDIGFVANSKSKTFDRLVWAQTPEARKAEADRLLQQGVEQFQTSQFEAALQSWQEALTIYRQIKDRVGEVNALGGVGIAYYSLGDYPKAIDYHQQSLQIAREIKDRLGEEKALGNIGLAYDALGNYAKAIEYHQQRLAIAREIKDRLGEGQSLGNLGIAYHALGDYRKAIDYHQQTLTIAREIKDRLVEGKALGNLGLAYRSLGDYRKAIDYLQQRLVIAREIKDRLGEGNALGNLGIAHYSLGDYRKAIEYEQQYLAIAREIKNRQGEGNALNNLGLALFKSGNLTAAETTLTNAIEVLESLRGGLKDAEKVSIFDTQSSPYRTLQQVLIAQNKTDAAIEIAERGRARAFVELLAQKFSPNPQEAPLPTSLKPTIDQIKQIAKDQNATIVQYSTIVYDELIYIWVIKPTGEIAFKQVDLKSLDKPLAEIAERSRVVAATGREPSNDTLVLSGNQRNSQTVAVTRELLYNQQAANSLTKPIIINPSNSYKRLQQVYDLLIKPIADQLPSDPDARVIFIPQDSLFRVPFAALIDENGKYLIQKHTIITAPSIQVLEFTYKQRSRRAGEQGSGGGRNILIVGNPTMPFSQDNPSERLKDLPFAEQEANEIAKLLNTEFLTGERATKAAVIQQMQQARIIHLATHGLFNDKQALQSSIALAPSGNDNGLLTADEILNLKLNAELIVLSACDTGRGQITGDGVIGLSRSLISAGASSVVVSLWPVWDDSTQLLMTKFYSHWQRNPDKAKALRQAMLDVMQEKPAPQHWAAFTLIGEAF